ncbi:hypothetical protein TTRE_0000941001 [Trichuris trichiura]|uniref:Uncharacterized protein n=1 Tax=Trichuris trichiura TaxID=36087 RepID=A0A077ZQF4_TRITR|nr:hypothetical protein TTRE_0000941001 [Trichuris trichiura]
MSNADNANKPEENANDGNNGNNGQRDNPNGARRMEELLQSALERTERALTIIATLENLYRECVNESAEELVDMLRSLAMLRAMGRRVPANISTNLSDGLVTMCSSIYRRQRTEKKKTQRSRRVRGRCKKNFKRDNFSDEDEPPPPPPPPCGSSETGAQA